MKISFLMVLLCVFVTSCSTNNSVSKAATKGVLDTSNEVKVVEAVVDNPFPDCQFLDSERFTADLSVPRSIRGYLANKEGDVCKKSR